MARTTLALLLFLIDTTYVLATEGYETLNKNSAVPAIAESPHESKNTNPDTVNLDPENTPESPMYKSAVKHASSTIIDFLEYGMVPVEDLEAQLKELSKTTTLGKPSKGKGKGKLAIINAAKKDGEKNTELEDCEEDEDEDEDEDDEDDEDKNE